MASNDSTMVFSPGAWHQPSCFNKTRAVLHARGWVSEAVRYPTVGAEPPTKHMADDAAAIRTVLTRLADEGKKIVLVVHSYGGVSAGHSVKDLGWKQRAKVGKTGGITMLIYLSAFAPLLGKSIKDMLGGKFAPWMKFEGDYCHVEDPSKIFYHDLSPEDLKTALSELRHQSGPIFTDVVGYEPWHEIECGYVICEDDQAIPAALQEQMSSVLGNDAFIARINASHSPFVSCPEELAGILEKAAAFGYGKVVA